MNIFFDKCNLWILLFILNKIRNLFEEHTEYKYISSKSQLPPFDKDLLAWVTPTKVNFFQLAE